MLDCYLFYSNIYLSNLNIDSVFTGPYFETDGHLFSCTRFVTLILIGRHDTMFDYCILCIASEIVKVQNGKLYAVQRWITFQFMCLSKFNVLTRVNQQKQFTKHTIHEYYEAFSAFTGNVKFMCLRCMYWSAKINLHCRPEVVIVIYKKTIDAVNQRSSLKKIEEKSDNTV